MNNRTKWDEMVQGQNMSIASQAFKSEILISQPQDDQIIVNGKLVYYDQNQKWIAPEELNVSETKAFREFLLKQQSGECGTHGDPNRGT